MADVEDTDRLRVSMTVSDIDSVRTVLTRLEELDGTVDPSGLSVADPDGEDLTEIDVGSITPKQWEALELAYDRGYYRKPREADLEELAAELGVSKSAVSQRLRAVESHLVEAVLRSVSPWVVLDESASGNAGNR